MRLARKGEIEEAEAVPAEDVEAGRPLLILHEIGPGVGGIMNGIVDTGSVQCDEAIGVRVGQRRQHHAVHDGVDGSGRADANRQSHNCEERDGFGALPRAPGANQHHGRASYRN